jgi:hypothetical protein
MLSTNSTPINIGDVLPSAAVTSWWLKPTPTEVLCVWLFYMSHDNPRGPKLYTILGFHKLAKETRAGLFSGVGAATFQVLERQFRQQ